MKAIKYLETYLNHLKWLPDPRSLHGFDQLDTVGQYKLIEIYNKMQALDLATVKNDCPCPCHQDPDFEHVTPCCAHWNGRTKKGAYKERLAQAIAHRDIVNRAIKNNKK